MLYKLRGFVLLTFLMTTLFLSPYFVSAQLGRKNLSECEIYTIAGTGKLGVNKSIKPPLQYNFSSPHGIVLDKEGNIYFSDLGLERVFRIDKNGLLEIVAGNGSLSSLNPNDGRSAKEAFLDDPSGITVDTKGSIYVADTSNNRIRRIDSETGIINTIAGIGDMGFSGDNKPAVKAKLSFPRDVAVDKSGNVYITDSLNHRIRRVDAVTKIITTVAGKSEIKLGSPGFSEAFGGYKGDGGLAVNALLNYPYSIVVDEANNIFFSDSLNNRIRKIDSQTGIITTIAGNGKVGFDGDGGPAINAKLNKPVGIALDVAGNLFIADRNNHRVRRVDAETGTIETIVGDGKTGYKGDRGPAINARLYNPTGISIDAAGNLFITDNLNHVIRVVSCVGDKEPK